MLAKATPRSIEDLVDFYKHWPAMRDRANALVERPDMGRDEREILKWMIRVIDRVGPSDLSEE